MDDTHTYLLQAFRGDVFLTRQELCARTILSQERTDGVINDLIFRSYLVAIDGKIAITLQGQAALQRQQRQVAAP